MKQENQHLTVPVITGLALALFIAACSSPKPDFDPKNPPTGGTPAEFGFQFAQAIAKNGNCDQALPTFICLGDQGPGWELALHSGGVCALEAAKLWTGPLQVRPGFFDKNSTVSFDKPYYRTKGALHEKGISLLRRSAASGWPDSQAVLARSLSENEASSSEAKLWLERYDHNPRRKIYGSNVIESTVRENLDSVKAPPETDPMWTRKILVKTSSQDPYCQQVMRLRPQRGSPEAPDADDDPLLEKIPSPETVDRPRRRLRQ